MFKTDSTVPTTASTPFIAATYRKVLFNLLAKAIHGSLIVRDPAGSHYFGDTGSSLANTIMLTIEDFDVYQSFVLGGGLGAAKTYIEGRWHTDSLVNLFEFFLKNKNLMNRFDFINKIIDSFSHWLIRLSTKNSQKGSRQNIQAHYDLSNDFFNLFLDSTKMYSCAIFESNDEPLLRASHRKLDAICQSLAISPNDHILEIGTGWGGFAIHAAVNYGCHVTTTTISKEQYAYTRSRIDELQLNDKITLLFDDYRDLSGEFDKLVSIEMIEAVGHEYYPAFFKQCNNLLKPGGKALIQAITIQDKEFNAYKNSVDFIKKYIFPGGCLPSVNEILNVTSKHTSLNLSGLRDIGLHYATTLAKWREAFLANLPKVKALGFDDEFIRCWDYYFCYCEAGFRQRYISTAHLIFDRID